MKMNLERNGSQTVYPLILGMIFSLHTDGIQADQLIVDQIMLHFERLTIDHRRASLDCLKKLSKQPSFQCECCL